MLQIISDPFSFQLFELRKGVQIGRLWEGKAYACNFVSVSQKTEMINHRTVRANNFFFSTV